MTLTIRSANCTKATWVDPALKKKNVKATIGETVEMPRQKRKAEITKTSLETLIIPLAPTLARANHIRGVAQRCQARIFTAKIFTCARALKAV